MWKIWYFSAVQLYRRVRLCETAGAELPQLQKRRLNQWEVTLHQMSQNLKQTKQQKSKTQTICHLTNPYVTSFTFIHLAAQQKSHLQCFKSNRWRFEGCSARPPSITIWTGFLAGLSDQSHTQLQEPTLSLRSTLNSCSWRRRSFFLFSNRLSPVLRELLRCANAWSAETGCGHRLL